MLDTILTENGVQSGGFSFGWRWTISVPFVNLKNLLSAFCIFSTEGRSSCQGRKFLVHFFSSFEKDVSLLQLVQVLLDREEDAMNVCWLDCADELRAGVELDAVFSPLFV